MLKVKNVILNRIDEIRICPNCGEHLFITIYGWWKCRYCFHTEIGDKCYGCDGWGCSYCPIFAEKQKFRSNILINLFNIEQIKGGDL